MQHTSNVTPLHRQDCAARPLACVQPLVVLTGRQIRQLAALAGSEEAEVAVGYARASDAGQAGLHAWHTNADTAPIRLVSDGGVLLQEDPS